MILIVIVIVIVIIFVIVIVIVLVIVIILTEISDIVILIQPIFKTFIRITIMTEIPFHCVFNLITSLLFLFFTRHLM